MKPRSDDRHAPGVMLATLAGTPLALLAGFGTMALWLIAAGFWHRGPDTAALALMLATLTALPYSLALLWADRHESEPWWLVTLSFAWGATAAAFTSMTGTLLARAALHLVVPPADVEAWLHVIGAPLVEEPIKAVALIGLLALFRRHVDGLLDGLVYGGLVGLGFAWFENFMYYAWTGADGPARMVELAWLRGIVCGIGTHPTFTALVGAAIGAHRVLRRGHLRWLLVPGALVLAMAAHTAWNVASGPLIHDEASVLRALLIGAPRAVLLLQSPFLLLLAVVVWIEWSHEDSVIVAFLGREPVDIVTSEEIALLVPARRRLRREIGTLIEHGPGAFWLHRELTQALIRLSFAAWHHEQDEVTWTPDDDPEVAWNRQVVRSARLRGARL